MSTVNDEVLMGREEGRRLYEEAGKLLRLAEALQDKCEQYVRRLGMLLAVYVSAIAGFVIGLTGLNIELPDDSIYKTLMIAFASSYVLALGVFLAWTRAKTRQQLVRERRALHSIVDMLHGLEKGIAEKNNLSALERAEFRIRLSRLDVGPGQQREEKEA